MPVLAVACKRREERHLRGFFRSHLVDDTLLGADQRRQFRQEHASHRPQITLSLQHAREAGKIRLEPVLLRIAISGEKEIVDHGVDVVFQLGHFTAGLHLNGSREVALGDRGSNLGNGSDLVGQVVGQEVDVAGEILPRTRGARHVGLATEPAFDADFAGYGCNLVGEGGQRVRHVVNGFRQSCDFTFRVYRQLLSQFAVGDGGHYFHNAAHLFSQVSGHYVHVVSEVLPCACHTRHLRLAAQLAFRADFAGHASHFGSEGVELIHHRVDGVLELENLAFHVHRDLARQIAAGHGRGDFGDVTHLTGEVTGHRVYGVREILPGAGDARHVGLSSQTTFSADLARHACHFASERVELIHHRVDGVFEQEDFAADVHCDFFREVAAGDGCGDFGNIANLTRQVAGHRVDGVGEILPRTANAWNLCLPAEFAIGAHFACHTGDFRRKRAQLIHHRVDGVFELKDFAFDVHRDLTRQIASSHSHGYFSNVSHLAGKVAGHEVHVVGKILPCAGYTRHLCLPAQFAFCADFARHACHLAGERVELIHHRVERVLKLQNLAAHVHRDLAREIAGSDGRRHLSDVSHLAGEIAGHEVDIVRQILPGAANSGHLRLAAQLAFGADFAGHARDFTGERVELVHHGVDGVLEFEDFALNVDGNLAGQIASRDGGGDLGNIADLGRQVAGHC